MPQKPKQRTKAYEMAGEARFQLSRRTFCQRALSINGLLVLLASCPHWKYCPKATSWQRKGRQGTSTKTSLSWCKKPQESSLDLRFRAVIRHTLLLPIIHTQGICTVSGFLPPPTVVASLCQATHIPQLSLWLLRKHVREWTDLATAMFRDLRIKIFLAWNLGPWAFAPTH